MRRIDAIEQITVKITGGRVIFPDGTFTTWDFINPYSAYDLAYELKGKADIKKVELVEWLAKEYIEKRYNI